MIFYKQRKMIVELYNEWLKETNALNCGESFLAFLQISGWLNEEDIMQYFEYYTAPKATCEYCEYAEKTDDIDLYYCKKHQNVHYDDFYCSEGRLKDEHDKGSIAVEIK